ncbi:hypothetical protein B566_EDAN004639 [Ephemera danica]|nr:hypothetical protein B566_EDAN004639 [Ephemera danica]
MQQQMQVHQRFRAPRTKRLFKSFTHASESSTPVSYTQTNFCPEAVHYRTR